MYLPKPHSGRAPARRAWPWRKKIVQAPSQEVLSAVFRADFIACSYGGSRGSFAPIPVLGSRAGVLVLIRWLAGRLFDYVAIGSICKFYNGLRVTPIPRYCFRNSLVVPKS